MKYKLEVRPAKAMHVIQGFKTQALRNRCLITSYNIAMSGNKATVEVEMELNTKMPVPAFPDLYANPDGSVVDYFNKEKGAVPIERYEEHHFEPVMVASGNISESKCFSIWRLDTNFFNVMVYPEPITPTFNIDAIELKYNTRVDFMSEEAHSFEEAYMILYECLE